MVGPAHRLPAGEGLRGVQPQAQDGDARPAEQGRDGRAGLHRVGHGMGPVSPGPPRLFQGRAPEDHRGIDAHPLGPQGGDGLSRAQVAFRVCAGQSGHHLQNEVHPRSMHKVSSFQSMTVK